MAEDVSARRAKGLNKTMTQPFRISISLTPELEQIIASRISSGKYQSATEVVGDALRLLEEREIATNASLDEVRRKIAIGLEQAKQGLLLDGEGVFAELELELLTSDNTI